MLRVHEISLAMIIDRMMFHIENIAPEYVCDEEKEKEFILVPVAKDLNIEIEPTGMDQNYRVTLVSTRLGGRYGKQVLGTVEYHYVTTVVHTALINERD